MELHPTEAETISFYIQQLHIENNKSTISSIITNVTETVY
jgi:hypothetical protein